MPIPPDPHEDADYRALVDALAQEGLPRRAEAARAVEGVMCALAQRLSSADFDDVRELLPAPFRTRLAACERHAPAPRTEFHGPEDFHRIVAEDVDRDVDAVEPLVRSVFAALRAQLSEREGEEIAARLPHDLAPLWRRPS